jgi:hypothetical protein
MDSPGKGACPYLRAIALKVVTTSFCMGVHTFLHCAERVAGIVKVVTGKSDKNKVGHRRRLFAALAWVSPQRLRLIFFRAHSGRL